MNREDVELSPWRHYGEDYKEVAVFRDLKIYHRFRNPDKYKLTMRLGKDKSQYVLEVYDYGNDSGEVFVCDGFVEVLNKAEEEIDKIIDAIYDDRGV